MQLKRLKSDVYHDTLIGNLNSIELESFKDGLFIRISTAIPDLGVVCASILLRRTSFLC